MCQHSDLPVSSAFNISSIEEKIHIYFDITKYFFMISVALHDFCA